MKFIKAFLVALVGSVLVNEIIVLVAGPMVNNPDMPLHALSVGPVGMLTAIGAIGATIVYALMRMFMRMPQKPFMWVSLVVLLASFIPDYMIIGQTSGMFAGATLPEALLLMGMHIVAAVIIVFALVKIWGAKMAK